MEEEKGKALFVTTYEALGISKERFRELARILGKAFYKYDNAKDFLNELLEEIHGMKSKRDIFTLGFLAGKVLGLNDIRSEISMMIECSILSAMFED